MPANQDFKELFKTFNDENVEYLVVGAYAVIYYTKPRYTKDLDIWINPTHENALRVYNALKKFGAPLIDIRPESFTDPALIYQIGIEPNRIDIIMSITGCEFSRAWNSRSSSTYEDIPIHILSKEDLIKAKKATGRPRDMLDVQLLED